MNRTVNSALITSMIFFNAVPAFAITAFPFVPSLWPADDAFETPCGSERLPTRHETSIKPDTGQIASQEVER